MTYVRLKRRSDFGGTLSDLSTTTYLRLFEVTKIRLLILPIVTILNFFMNPEWNLIVFFTERSKVYYLSTHIWIFLRSDTVNEIIVECSGTKESHKELLHELFELT